MNKFEEYKIKTSEKNELLVLDYLENVKDYINKNSLDFDLYYDIEERVYEKLATAEKLSQLKIKQIINEIGEPEDIFELEDSKANSDFFVFARNLKNSGINTIKKIFETGFNIKNFIVFVKTIIISLFKFSKKLIIKIYNFIIDTIKYLYKNFKLIFSYILKLIKKAFNLLGSFIGFIILGFSIILLFFVPILISGIEISNINYTNIIPFELILSYSFLVLSIAILGIYFILKKKFLLHFIAFGITSIFIFSFGFLGSTKVYDNFSYPSEVEKTYKLETESELLNISFYDFDVYGNIYLLQEMFDEYDLNIVKSENEDFNIKIKTEFLTKDENKAEEIKNNFNDFNVFDENGNIIINLDSRKTFKNKTDFVPIYRRVELQIPEGIILKSDYRLKYKNYKFRKCESNSLGLIGDELVCVERK